VAGYVEELAALRATLDRRHDDLKSGRVKPIGGDEVAARLSAKSAARRAERS
jgi:cob(I)alamin adenosyltransferase